MRIKRLKISFNIASGALRKNRLRTFLTVLGVVIGISSVTVIVSAGGSIKELVYNQIDSFGSNLIEIDASAPQSSGGEIAQVQGIVITTLNDKDKEDIDKLPNVDKSYAVVTAQEIASWNSSIQKSLIYGVSPEFIDIDASEIDQGRFFDKDENNSLSRVVVLGQTIAKDLFGSNDPIGKSIKINKQSYKVIGIMKPRGTVFFFDMDKMIYMPIKTTQKLVLGIDHFVAIEVHIIDTNKNGETIDDMTHILRSNHNITNPDRDDFIITSMADAQDLVGTIIGGVTLLLIALAAVSLIVGGVGIMNIMYATVAERTFEIGLRKSVGASKKEILQQFLAEALIVTLLGGLYGILLGLVMIYIIYLVANYYGLDWSFSLSWLGLLLAFVFSVIVGLIFGIYPAKQAADLDPITALRKE